MNEIALEKFITTVALAVALIGNFLICLSLWVAKRGAEGRSKYKFEIWLNSPRPKSGALDALVNALNKLTRKPEKR